MFRASALMWLFLIPGAAHALDLAWSTGERNAVVQEARACTLLVTSGNSEVSLPQAWHLSWTARSTLDVPFDFRITPPTSTEAGVCDVRPALSAASILSHADTVVHCGDAGGARNLAKYVIRVEAGVSATIRLISAQQAEVGAPSAGWPEVTINGGCDVTFPPILVEGAILLGEVGPRIKVLGMFDRQISSASLVGDASGERFDLQVLEQTASRLLLAAPLGSSLDGRLDVRDVVGVVGAIDLQESGPVASGPWAPGRLLVRFKPGEIEPPAGRVEGLCAEFHARSSTLLPSLASAGVVHLERLLPWFRHEDVHSRNLLGEPITLEDMADFYVAHLKDDADAVSARGSLGLVPEVRHAELDLAVGSYLPANDPYYTAGLQWGLENTGQTMCGYVGFSNNDINASTAWDRSTGVASVRIAILDTGIDSFHPDISPRAVLDTSFVPNESPFDLSTNGHGTAVTGIAAAKGGDAIGVAGVAWNVTPVSVKVFNSSGGGWTIWLVRGIDHARVKGYPIINISGGIPPGPGFPAPPADTVSALNVVCHNAFLTGQFIVAASGNTESGGVDEFSDLRFDAYPAAFTKRVYAVGAILNDGPRWRDSRVAQTFCNANPAQCRSSNFGPWLDAMAPGGRFIVTTKNISVYADSFHHLRNCNASNLTGTAFWGTSAAAPFVSGTAALLTSYALGFTPPVVLTGDDLEQILNRNATATVFPSPNQWYGHGLIRANLAANFVAPPKTVIQDYLQGEKPLAYLRAADSTH
ncbi:MAG TPA: S8 family serine peptidase, partial [Candidatus Eisenbacteria bacterium]|nr:S8 family serine peptidase [Candidatus Eisenbacteria bacterium]